VRAQLASELGREAEAREALEALSTDDFAGVPFNEGWLVSIGLLAETASALGDVGRSDVLYRLLAPYGDRIAIAYPEIATGPVARYLGLLATATARWNEAERHFEKALELSERIGAQVWLAHDRRNYARLLQARDAPGDSSRAERLLDESRATYLELDIPDPLKKASLRGGH
jgi:hypothetical protein